MGILSTGDDMAMSSRYVPRVTAAAWSCFSVSRVGGFIIGRVVHRLPSRLFVMVEAILDSVQVGLALFLENTEFVGQAVLGLSEVSGLGLEGLKLVLGSC